MNPTQIVELQKILTFLENDDNTAFKNWLYETLMGNPQPDPNLFQFKHQKIEYIYGAVIDSVYTLGPLKPGNPGAKLNLFSLDKEPAGGTSNLITATLHHNSAQCFHELVNFIDGPLSSDENSNSWNWGGIPCNEIKISRHNGKQKDVYFQNLFDALIIMPAIDATPWIQSLTAKFKGNISCICDDKVESFDLLYYMQRNVENTEILIALFYAGWIDQTEAISIIEEAHFKFPDRNVFHRDTISSIESFSLKRKLGMQLNTERSHIHAL